MKFFILIIAVCFGKLLNSKKDSALAALGSNTEDDDSTGKIDKKSKEDKQKNEQKILSQTQVEDNKVNQGEGVSYSEALEAFEQKMKDMDPIDITIPETKSEEQKAAVAYEKAEDMNKDIVEGDIIKTDLVEAIMNNNAVAKRVLSTSEKWSLTIAYELPGQINGGGLMERAINEAMRELSRVSCLKFLKRQNNGNSDNNLDINGVDREPFLKFIQGKGCYSYIGKQNHQLPEYNGQEISIGPGCEWKGIVIHEILHALGFFHEQSRLDRDDYVKIIEANIVEDKRHNFKKYDVGEADTMRFPYDYSSIMHYGEKAFAKDKSKNTIEIKHQRNGISIGMLTLSRVDKAKLNAYYCFEQNKQEDSKLRRKNKMILRRNVYAPRFV